MSLPLREAQDLAPRRLIGSPPLLLPAAGGQEGGDLARRADHLGGDRGAQSGVTDHSHRAAPLGQAAGELRVVGQHRPHPRQDAPVLVPELVDMSPGRLPGDPPGDPRAGGNLAVQSHGIFQGHIGPLFGNVVEEDEIQPPALLFQYVLSHFHPIFPKLGNPLPRHQGIGVPGAHHHPGDPRLQDGPGAGGLPPLVAAGLQGDVQNGPRRGLGTAGQSLPLRVGLAAPVVPPPADHPSLLHDHRPHHGVGRGPSPPPLRQRQGQFHVV